MWSICHWKGLSKFSSKEDYLVFSLVTNKQPIIILTEKQRCMSNMPLGAEHKGRSQDVGFHNGKGKFYLYRMSHLVSRSYSSEKMTDKKYCISKSRDNLTHLWILLFKQTCGKDDSFLACFLSLALSHAHTSQSLLHSTDSSNELRLPPPP